MCKGLGIVKLGEAKLLSVGALWSRDAVVVVFTIVDGFTVGISIVKLTVLVDDDALSEAFCEAEITPIEAELLVNDDIRLLVCFSGEKDTVELEKPVLVAEITSLFVSIIGESDNVLLSAIVIVVIVIEVGEEKVLRLLSV